MRGQETGSESEHETDGSAAPATPPPSFGRPSPSVPQTDPAADEQPHLPPAWPEPKPPLADQPWTVPVDDGTPYDWLADPEPGGAPPVPGDLAPSPPGAAAGPPDGPWVSHPLGDGPPAPVPLDNPPLPGAPVSPGTPSWQPPPAFTAAAAGMHVWPSPASGVPGDPPWPAATGEPVGETSWPDLEDRARPGEPGDVPVWPPDLLAEEPGDDTVKVRVPAPDHREPAPPPPSGPDPAPWTGLPPQETGPVAQESGPVAQAAEPAPGAPSSAAAPQPDGPVSGERPVPDAAPHDAPPASGAVTSATPAEPWPAPPAEPWSATPVESWSAPPAPPAPPRETAPAVPPAAGPDPSAPFHGPGAADHPTPPGGIPVVSPSALIPPAAPGDRAAGPFPPAVPGGHRSAPLPSAGARPPAAFPGGPPVPPAGEPVRERGPFQPVSALDAGPTAPAKPSPASPARNRGRTALIAAAVAIVVGGIGVGAFLAYPSADSGPAPGAAVTSVPEPTESPVDEPEEPALADTAMLDSELTDPGRMTVADAFSKKVTIGGTRFTRVKTHLTQECDKAAAGAFATALRTGDCRRVLRATYVDSKKRYAVTTGVAVLPTRESAVTADQAKNLEKNLWFRGLPGTAGTGAERVHIAGGYAAGLVWGRYIVFSYATFADGHTPTAKEKGLGKVSGAFRDQTAKAVERRVTG
ncbi:hypothetical protein [Planomonospora venezuelensis]|uniref:Uncharacterized protein n=1 Tax=Planomonospora venezuelensis TaxID=1999 RepID=A0A841D329_PLAVE|nr:hypothetical protein [Planomonospora venezuelensis]MBB5963889.1 hypothetical protein [Planomonospora venezuelensis]GIN03700.1 hypothetical protein Pve01_53580 [Planomonospora venezuelensis]